ncbi:MAG: hypothetical protein KAG95_01315 [Bacteroidales bacterium]|nr:hypothetical protein [Bacteroidales bacterium]
MEDLSKIAPNLSKIKKENNFNVPDNYFDDFPSIVQERISKKSSTFISKFLFLILKPQFIAAFSIVVIFFVSYSIFNSHKETNILSSNDVAEYFEQNQTDYDENLLIDVIVNDPNIDISNNSDNDVIIDYLIDNDIDYSTLVNAL